MNKTKFQKVREPEYDSAHTETLDRNQKMEIHINNYSQRVATMLDQLYPGYGFDNLGTWEFTDFYPIDEPIYAKINYTDKNTPGIYAFLHGALISLEYYKIISLFPPTITSVITDHMEPNHKLIVPEIGEVLVRDCQFAPFINGPLICVSLINGKIIISSVKKVDASRSRWGYGPTFTEVYEQLGGPFEELFDKNKSYGYHNYFFILGAKPYKVSSKDRTTVLAYLDDYSVSLPNDFQQMGISSNDIDFTYRKPGFMEEELIMNNVTPYIYTNEKRISLEEANQILDRSWETEVCSEFTDKRVRPGGELMAYTRDGRVFKIDSSGSLYRKLLRLGDPNIKLSMYKFYDKVSHDEPEEYNELFPTLSPNVNVLEINKLAKETKLVCWETVDSTLGTVAERIQNLMWIYLLTAPFHLQPEIMQHITEIMGAKIKLTDFFFKVIRLTKESDLMNRLNKLPGAEKESNQTLFKKTLDVMYTLNNDISRRAKNDMIYKQGIRELLDVQSGDTLYRFMKVYNMLYS